MRPRPSLHTVYNQEIVKLGYQVYPVVCIYLNAIKRRCELEILHSKFIPNSNVQISKAQSSSRCSMRSNSTRDTVGRVVVTKRVPSSPSSQVLVFQSISGRGPQGARGLYLREW